MSLRFFTRFARNNAWANHRLYEACAGLSFLELTTPRYSSFPTILATLNHILVVDWYYLDAMRGEGFGLALHDLDMPYSEFEPLRAAQADSDRDLIDFCDSLTEDDLDRMVSIRRGNDRLTEERIDDLLSHLLHHQIHHRGQIHAMLASTHVAPPALDEFFERHYSALRVIDFAALGWKGEEI